MRTRLAGAPSGGRRALAFASPLSDLIGERERELAALSHGRVGEIETRLAAKEAEADESGRRLEALRQDFEYNLSLLAGRDEEIARLEALAAERERAMGAQKAQLDEAREALVGIGEAAATAKEREAGLTAELARAREALEDAAVGASDELARVRAAYERERDGAARQARGRETAADAARVELAATYDDLLRRREAEHLAARAELQALLADADGRAKAAQRAAAEAAAAAEERREAAEAANKAARVAKAERDEAAAEATSERRKAEAAEREARALRRDSERARSSFLADYEAKTATLLDALKVAEAQLDEQRMRVASVAGGADEELARWRERAEAAEAWAAVERARADEAQAQASAVAAATVGEGVAAAAGASAVAAAAAAASAAAAAASAGAGTSLHAGEDALKPDAFTVAGERADRYRLAAAADLAADWQRKAQRLARLAKGLEKECGALRHKVAVGCLLGSLADVYAAATEADARVLTQIRALRADLESAGGAELLRAAAGALAGEQRMLKDEVKRLGGSTAAASALADATDAALEKGVESSARDDAAAVAAAASSAGEALDAATRAVEAAERGQAQAVEAGVNLYEAEPPKPPRMPSPPSPDSAEAATAPPLKSPEVSKLLERLSALETSLPAAAAAAAATAAAEAIAKAASPSPSPSRKAPASEEEAGPGDGPEVMARLSTVEAAMASLAQAQAAQAAHAEANAVAKADAAARRAAMEEETAAIRELQAVEAHAPGERPSRLQRRIGTLLARVGAAAGEQPVDELTADVRRAMRDGVEGTRGASGGPLALAGQGGALGTFDAALMGYDARARAVEEAPTGGAVRETTLSPSELDRERFDTFT